MSRNIRGRHWLITFNNPNCLPIDLINFFTENSWNYIFQLERGEQGTEHFQIYLRTNPIYFNQLNQYFIDRNYLIHLEHVRNKNSAMLYCCKDDSRISQQYWTDIEHLIVRPKVKALVAIKRKLDAGQSLTSIMDSEEHFPTWCSYNRSLVMYNALKQRGSGGICFSTKCRSYGMISEVTATKRRSYLSCATDMITRFK